MEAVAAQGFAFFRLKCLKEANFLGGLPDTEK